MIEVVRCWWSRGADLDRMNGEGWTAPMFSVEGMGKVVRLLVDKGGHSKM